MTGEIHDPGRARGTWYAIGAFGLWGILPVYWKLFGVIPAFQLLSHRVTWSFLLLVAILLCSGRLRDYYRVLARPRVLALHLVAALLIGVNWLIFLWAVNANFIVEASLGYFINPLLTVALGVLVLRERLRPWQWLPIGLAALGVLYLTLDYGRLPWIALTLAFTFAAYSLAKKKAPLSALEGLTLETGALFIPAVVYLGLAEARGQSSFLHVAPMQSALLVGSGLMTVLPLLFFAGAARRIPLSLVGMLQYLAPTLQFLVGAFIYHEPLSPSRLVGFVIVWVALLVFVAEGIFTQRNRKP